MIQLLSELIVNTVLHSNCRIQWIDSAFVKAVCEVLLSKMYVDHRFHEPDKRPWKDRRRVSMVLPWAFKEGAAFETMDGRLAAKAANRPSMEDSWAMVKLEQGSLL